MRTIQLARERRDPIAAEVDRYTDVYYPAYQDGFLLEGVGIANQPARYVEMIGEVREMEARIESKMLDRLKASDGTK